MPPVTIVSRSRFAGCEIRRDQRRVNASVEWRRQRVSASARPLDRLVRCDCVMHFDNAIFVCVDAKTDSTVQGYGWIIDKGREMDRLVWRGSQNLLDDGCTDTLFAVSGRNVDITQVQMI